MTLTPRQIAAYLEFNDLLERVERANALAVSIVGAQGDEKAIKQQFETIYGAEIQGDG